MNEKMRKIDKMLLFRHAGCIRKMAVCSNLVIAKSDWLSLFWADFYTSYK